MQIEEYWKEWETGLALIGITAFAVFGVYASWKMLSTSLKLQKELRHKIKQARGEIQEKINIAQNKQSRNGIQGRCKKKIAQKKPKEDILLKQLEELLLYVRDEAVNPYRLNKYVYAHGISSHEVDSHYYSDGKHLIITCICIHKDTLITYRGLDIYYPSGDGVNTNFLKFRDTEGDGIFDSYELLLLHDAGSSNIHSELEEILGATNSGKSLLMELYKASSGETMH